ncbi:MAG: nuclear transport factor 2 family protein [Acidobacteria bacterium]|nr:nuclear transport factor 2 family protein [Acidobacteriota bacterium]
MTAREHILRLERRQERDFNRRNLKACLAPFAPGFVGFSSTRHDRIAGRAALKKTFQHYLRQSPRVRYRIAQPRVQMFGGTAVASFYWTVELGGGHRVRGRGSHVFIRRGRSWRIVHEHFSRLP